MVLSFQVEHQFATEGVTEVRLRGVDEPGNVACLRLLDREQARQFEPGQRFVMRITAQTEAIETAGQ